MTAGFSDADLGAIEARAEAATSAPWEIFRYRNGGGRIHLSGDDGRQRELIADMEGALGSVATIYNEGDREFLLAARTDIPRLVAELRSERAARQRVEALADSCVQAGTLSVMESAAEIGEMFRAALRGEPR